MGPAQDPQDPRPFHLTAHDSAPAEGSGSATECRSRITGDTLSDMSITARHDHEVSVRDLRNRGGQVLDRVVRGETLTVTKDGTPVAELRPVPRRSLPAAELIARARRAPKVDAELLRRDIDSVLDQSL